MNAMAQPPAEPPAELMISTPERRRRAPRALTVIAILVIVILAVFIAVPGLVATHNPIALDIRHRLAPPGAAHLFGSDEGGRDIFSRIVHGTRYSVGISVIIVLVAALFGSFYGALAGMAPRWLDDVLMRIVDVFLGFPALVLALAIAAAIGRGLGSVVLALTIIWWPGYARLVRSEVLRLRERPHVEAARALGVSQANLLRRHILPFVLHEVNIRVTTDIGYALVAVTALSFLGLGAQSPTPEWGLLIRDSRTYFGSAWWYLVFPGAMIMLTATAFSLVGDALAGHRSGEH
jgi:peptide/nickel transport system permease protein